MDETKLPTSPLTMRPHHALCALFFEGKGYSPAFIENMTALLANPNQIVQITMGCDSLCQECPHNQDGVCDDAAKVAQFDQRVLSLSRETFHAEQAKSLSELCQSVYDTILLQGLLADVCGECEWATLCQGKWQRGEFNQFLLQPDRTDSLPA